MLWSCFIAAVLFQVSTLPVAPEFHLPSSSSSFSPVAVSHISDAVETSANSVNPEMHELFNSWRNHGQASSSTPMGNFSAIKSGMQLYPLILKHEMI